MAQKNLVIMFSAGEASGDQHAANLFLALQGMCPGIKALGMGGAKMRQAGIDVRYDSRAIGVIGLVEIIKHYPEIRRALGLLQAMLVAEKPDLLVCVDYQKFNLKLAQFAKRQGIKVLFYVSPQIWASRPGRVKAYAKAVDMMAVIFPFETAYYQAAQVPVRYVGHPSVDKVKPLYTKTESLRRFGIDSQRKVVGLLPGSRTNEIERILPAMLDAAGLLQAKFPGVQFILPQADSVADSLLKHYLSTVRIPIIVVKQHPYDAIQCCDAVMTASGTASLELTLLGIPMVIAYRLSSLTYYIARSLIQVKFIGLPNIIAGKSVVKELIQHAATPGQLAAEIERLLVDVHYRQNMGEALAEIKHQLGPGGASKNMALLVMEMLNSAG